MKKSGKSIPTFGERLRAWRKARGMTQEQLADASGINRVSIAKVESGSRGPAFDTVQALAAALGVTIDALTTSMPEAKVDAAKKPAKKKP